MNLSLLPDSLLDWSAVAPLNDFTSERLHDFADRTRGCATASPRSHPSPSPSPPPPPQSQLPPTAAQMTGSARTARPVSPVAQRRPPRVSFAGAAEPRSVAGSPDRPLPQSRHNNDIPSPPSAWCGDPTTSHPATNCCASAGPHSSRDLAELLTFADVRLLVDALAARDRAVASGRDHDGYTGLNVTCSDSSSFGDDSTDKDSDDVLRGLELEGDYAWAHRFLAENKHRMERRAREAGVFDERGGEKAWAGEETVVAVVATAEDTPWQSQVSLRSPLPAHTRLHPAAAPRFATGSPSPALPVQPPPAWSFADFDIVRKIGQGRFGKLYFAHERSSGMPVVLKCLSKEMILLNNLFAQVQSEVELQAFAGCNGPHILPLHAYFWDDERVVLVLAYADGGSLADRLREYQHTLGTTKATVRGSITNTPHAQHSDEQNQQQQPQRLGLPLDAVRAAVAQVATALTFLHANGIVHGDIKPDNVLLSTNVLTRRREVRLADFSCAARLSGPSRLVRSVGGTLDYQAPEQVGGGPVSPAADVWALGVLAYELICGHPPFHSVQSVNEARALIAAGTVPYPAWLPPQARAFLEALLCVDECRRLTASEACMHHFLSGRPVSSTTASAGVSMARDGLSASSGRLTPSVTVSVSSRDAGARMDLSPLAFPSLWPPRHSSSSFPPPSPASLRSRELSPLTITGTSGPGATDISFDEGCIHPVDSSAVSAAPSALCNAPRLGLFRPSERPHTLGLETYTGAVLGAHVKNSTNSPSHHHHHPDNSTANTNASISGVAVASNTSLDSRQGRHSLATIGSEVSVSSMSFTCRPSQAWLSGLLPSSTAAVMGACADDVDTLNVSALTTVSAEESVSRRSESASSGNGERSPPPSAPPAGRRAEKRCVSASMDMISRDEKTGGMQHQQPPPHVRIYASRIGKTAASGTRVVGGSGPKHRPPTSPQDSEEAEGSHSPHGASLSTARSHSQSHSRSQGGTAIASASALQDSMALPVQAPRVVTLGCVQRLFFDEAEDDDDVEEKNVDDGQPDASTGVTDGHEVVWAAVPSAPPAPIVAQKRRNTTANDPLSMLLLPLSDMGPLW